MISRARMLELLLFDTFTGVIRWRVSRGRVRAGIVAGNVCADKNRRTQYSRIRINGRNFEAHRLMFFYVFNRWPREIDHADGNGLNNRIENLTEVTHQQNSRNRPLQLNNTSGVMGVHWDRREGKWCARIKTDGRKKSLGYFGNIFEAACARKSAEREYGFHKNHGRVSNPGKTEPGMEPGLQVLWRGHQNAKGARCGCHPV